MSRYPRRYTPEDLALFARYVEARADHRPAACVGGEACWVEKGPPAMGHSPTRCISCLGCGSSLMDGKRHGGRDGRPGLMAAQREAGR